MTGMSTPEVAACDCSASQLYAVIDGVRYEVEPAEATTPTSALFRAWCADCGGEFVEPFRVRT
jgi:hypothetical protein